MSEIYFVTNRRPNRKHNPDDFSGEFSTDGLSNLRYGKARVEWGRVVDVSVAREVLVLDRERGSLNLRRSVLGSQTMMDEIRATMRANGGDTLVFIHGYNTSFHESLLHGAELQRNFAGLNDGKGLQVVVFSWPSDGSVAPFLAYASDREDARAAGPGFARAFLKLADFLHGLHPGQTCNQCLHLMAHSMGAYLLRHAVQAIRRERADRPPRLFDQVFLMAADEDNDAFDREHKLRPLPLLARRVHVYFNSNDLALSVSDFTKGNPDRLGTDGPLNPRNVPGKVSLVDCTAVVDGAMEHGYHRESPRVVMDLAAVLSGVEPDEVPGRDYLLSNNHYRVRRD